MCRYQSCALRFFQNYLLDLFSETQSLAAMNVIH